MNQLAHQLGMNFDSSLAAVVAMAPSDSGFDPRQRRHLIRAQLVSQLILCPAGAP